MSGMWVVLVLIYSILKGSRDGMKKAALRLNSSDEILFFYSLIGFILIIPFSPNAFSVPPLYIWYSFIKAAVVCTAWICAFVALKNMTVSLYGIMDLSRMLFSTLFGIFLLGECMTAGKVVGIVLVSVGLVMSNLKKDSKGDRVTPLVLGAALANCLLNSVSAVMDKTLTVTMPPDALQFWFMFFLLVCYGGVLVVKREGVHIGTLRKNFWIPILSISLIVGDRLLFIANSDPESMITVMTVIKQSSVIVTILTGWLFFKEKHIGYKMLCAAIILCGICASVFFS